LKYNSNSAQEGKARSGRKKDKPRGLLPQGSVGREVQGKIAEKEEKSLPPPKALLKQLKKGNFASRKKRKRDERGSTWNWGMRKGKTEGRRA